MKRHIKKIMIVCFSMLLSMFIITGCGKKVEPLASPEASGFDVENASPDATEDVQGTDDSMATVTPDDVVSTGETTEDDASAKTKELPIYTINDDSLEAQAAVALIPEKDEITAELVVEAVVNNLEEHSLIVGIDAVTVDKDRVIVSFKQGTAPLATVGSGVEATILDCISQSLLDNLDSCKQVIFRAEGKSYESGHIVLGIDEAYAWK